jgi:hypothetical protein
MKKEKKSTIKYCGGDIPCSRFKPISATSTFGHCHLKKDKPILINKFLTCDNYKK